MNNDIFKDIDISDIDEFIFKLKENYFKYDIIHITPLYLSLDFIFNHNNNSTLEEDIFITFLSLSKPYISSLVNNALPRPIKFKHYNFYKKLYNLESKLIDNYKHGCNEMNESLVLLGKFRFLDKLISNDLIFGKLGNIEFLDSIYDSLTYNIGDSIEDHINEQFKKYKIHSDIDKILSFDNTDDFIVDDILVLFNPNINPIRHIGSELLEKYNKLFYECDVKESLIDSDVIITIVDRVTTESIHYMHKKFNAINDYKIIGIRLDISNYVTRIYF